MQYHVIVARTCFYDYELVNYSDSKTFLITVHRILCVRESRTVVTTTYKRQKV